MATVEVTRFYLYRWRYIIGYSIIGLALIGLLVFAGLVVPGAVSSQEIATLVKTDSLRLDDLSSIAMSNLPYHLLQALSVTIFGVHEFSIKLPSLILSLGSAVALIFLLRRWFSPGMSVLVSIVAITTGQFLFVTQSGTPGILYIFWPLILLLLGTFITRRRQGQFIWKILFFITAALSLYTPLSIYILLATLLTVGLHPHLRNVIRQLSKPRIAIAAGAGVALLAPLIWAIIKTPSLGLTILGIPSDTPDLWANAATLFQQYVLFWQPSSTSLMTPVFGLGSLLIIVIGMYRLIRTRDTTQSYLIIIWLLCLLPVLIVNPNYTSVTFLPLVLLLASGISSIIGYWYRLFPLNPYARVAGLVPLIVLVITLVGSGLDRYVYGYQYQPSTVANFTRDISLLPRDIPQIVASSEERPLYLAIARREPGVAVVDAPSTDRFVATRSARADFKGYEVESIVTSPAAASADRFYIYKKKLK